MVLLSGVLACFFLSCHEEKVPGRIPEIEIGRAMELVGKFGISEIADNISFVALETTDSSLVGAAPKVMVWGDRIIVSSRDQLLLVFDREDGHFCNSIGRPGNGPEGSAIGAGFYIDQTNGTVYLRALGNRSLLRYDINGNFLGRITPDIGRGERFSLEDCFFLVLNDTVTAHRYNTAFSGGNPFVFFFNGMDGHLLDTVPSVVSAALPALTLSGLVSITISKEGDELFGGTGLMRLKYQDGKTYNLFLGRPSLWTYGGQRYFKEGFIDTVYTVRAAGENSLTPRLALNLGEWQWPYEKQFDGENLRSRISIDYLMENENVIYFHFHTGDLQEYCGFYDKRSGKTKVMEGLLIEDDLYHFFPLTIKNISSAGEFLGVIEAPDILEWKEQNASVPGIPNIESLLNMDIEDNPVVVFIK
jgi:hypothetical protein